VLRFDAIAGFDPTAFVRGWRAVTGGKAIVVSADFPAPEIVHAFGMLPVPAESADTARSFREIVDGWIVPERFQAPWIPGGKSIFRLPGSWPKDVLSALDLLEAIAEWGGSVSGEPFSEGALRRSLSIFRGPYSPWTTGRPEPGDEVDPLVRIARRTVSAPTQPITRP